MSSSLPDPPANARAWSTGRGPAGLHEPFAGPDRAERAGSFGDPGYLLPMLLPCATCRRIIV